MADQMFGSGIRAMRCVRQMILSLVIVLAPMLSMASCCCRRVAADVASPLSAAVSCCDHTSGACGKSCCQKESAHRALCGPSDHCCGCCKPGSRPPRLYWANERENVFRPSTFLMLLPAEAVSTDDTVGLSLRTGPERMVLSPQNRQQAKLCVWKN